MKAFGNIRKISALKVNREPIHYFGMYMSVCLLSILLEIPEILLEIQRIIFQKHHLSSYIFCSESKKSWHFLMFRIWDLKLKLLESQVIYKSCKVIPISTMSSGWQFYVLLKNAYHTTKDRGHQTIECSKMYPGGRRTIPFIYNVLMVV